MSGSDQWGLFRSLPDWPVAQFSWGPGLLERRSVSFGESALVDSSVVTALEAYRGQLQRGGARCWRCVDAASPCVCEPLCWWHEAGQGWWVVPVGTWVLLSNLSAAGPWLTSAA